MKKYGLYVSLASKTSQEMYDKAELQIQKTAAWLMEKYNEKCQIKKDIGEYDYFIDTKNSDFIRDFIKELDDYLLDNNFVFYSSIAIIDKIDFVQKSKKSEIKDVVDFLREYININSGLAKSEYIVDEINYFQMSDGIMYRTNLKTDDFDRLDIKIAFPFDETDLVEFSHVIRVLNNAHSYILNTIDSITKEEK